MATILIDHLANLEAFLQRGGDAPEWTDIRIVQDRDINHGPVTTIPKASIQRPEDFASRFGILVGLGYSWINLVGNGVLNGTLLVSVEIPREPSGHAIADVLVNYSGPYLNGDGTKHWHIEDKIKVI